MKLAHPKIILTSILFLIFNTGAQESVQYTSALTPEEINKAWFKPVLLENKNPPVCKVLLEQGTKAFFSGIRDLEFTFSNVSELTEVEWGDQENKKIIINENSIYIGEQCGGFDYNESCTIWAAPSLSESENENENERDNYSDSQKIHTYGSYGNIKKLLKNKEGHYWLFVAQQSSTASINSEWKKYKSDESFIAAFELKANSTWEKTCGVALMPTQKSLENAKNIDKAFASINAMKAVADQVTGGSGGVTHGIYSSMFMDKVLYRPWSLSGSEIEPGDINSKIIDWGYLGVSEFEKISQYKLQLEETSKVIAQFYKDNYGWNNKKAYNLAHSSILNALEVDNKFGSYEAPFSINELRLRKAILENRPLEEIKDLSIDIPDMDRDIPDNYGNFNYTKNQESILNIAVKYPAALRSLLDNGANPNKQNGFGKTPLMYAIQFNQIEAVKILLAKDANPNLFTVIPEYGNIKRSGMTALHYAVRYASADIIKLLLNNGAYPFAKTSEKINAYPVDWLHFYTDQNAEEKNSNITTDQAAELDKLLKIPQPDEKSKKVMEYILTGEKVYQQSNNLISSYNNFKFALALDPKNERALNDFALLSLKLERWGEALESVQYIIDSTKDTNQKANAYYNYGLACEKIGKEYHLRNYNGNNYCGNGVVDPYMQSYQLKPMLIKSNKIVSLYKESKVENCKFPTNDTPEFLLSYGCISGAALCVISKKDKLINTDSTFSVSNCHFCGADSKIIERGAYFRIHPLLKTTYEFGDYHLAIYDAKNSITNGTFFINGKVCDRDGIRDADDYHGDNHALQLSKDEKDRLPREKIAVDPAALHNLFYVSEYGGPHLKSVKGDMYVQSSDNDYIKVMEYDHLLAPAKLYIRKGASFDFGESTLEADSNNDRILSVMTYKEFMTAYGNNIKDPKFDIHKKALIDLDKITQ